MNECRSLFSRKHAEPVGPVIEFGQDDQKIAPGYFIILPVGITGSKKTVSFILVCSKVEWFSLANKYEIPLMLAQQIMYILEQAGSDSWRCGDYDVHLAFL